jgi:LysR family nitrogen assimilation transcriptional regulator
MDVQRLRYFVCIAEQGSMSRASAVLGIVQPALSRQMRLLEESLGVALFRRTSRGVELTEEGEHLRSALVGPLHQIELALQNVGSPLAHIERDVVFGMPETTANILAVPLIEQLSAAFPRVSLRVVLDDSNRLVDAMLKGTVDLALIHGPAPDERLFYGDLVAEDLVLVGGPASELSAHHPVPFRDLADRPLILPSPQPGFRNFVENTALRLEVAINVRLEVDSLQLSKDLIAAGHAYGILPVSAFHREFDDGRLKYAPICEPVLTQRLGIAARPELVLPRRFVMEFGAVVRRQVAALVGGPGWPGTLLPTAGLENQVGD